MQRQIVIVVLSLIALLTVAAAPAFADGLSLLDTPANAGAYTVQRGDTLPLIARHFGVELYTLAAVNGIANLNYVTAGQVLNIAAARPQTPPSFPVYGAPVNASTYTVQSGDNLFRIALHFNVDLNTLAYVNGITDIRRITAGQVLNIAAARF